MRPDVPLRLDAALQRAMAKRPEDRFPSMAAFVTELEACLAALGQPDDDRTVIVPPPAPARPRARRRARAALAAAWPLLLGLVLDRRRARARTCSCAAAARRRRRRRRPVHLVASNAYDPQGDGSEHDELVANATDGNARTSWSTERYRGQTFGNLKDGVGLVLDAGVPSEPRTITVVSDTPGFTAKIEAGSSSDGPFDTVSGSKEVGSRTTFDLTMSHAATLLPGLDHEARAGIRADASERSDRGLIFAGVCSGRARAGVEDRCDGGCAPLLALLARRPRADRQGRRRDRPEGRQDARQGGVARPGVLRHPRGRGRRATGHAPASVARPGRLLRRALTRHRSASDGDRDCGHAAAGAGRHQARVPGSDEAIPGRSSARSSRRRRPAWRPRTRRTSSPSRRGASGVHGARARARSAGRGAPGTGSRTPRRASRRRSSP